jgi:hypothetical protein
VCSVPLYRDGEPDEESFAGNPLTSDRLRYNRNIRLWQAAQELSAHVPSAGWAFAALRSCARLQKLDDRTPLKCPALLVVAGQDVVVSNEATQQFARFVPGAAPVVINGARHDILCEQDIYRDQFFAAADAFLADRLRGRTGTVSCALRQAVSGGLMKLPVACRDYVAPIGGVATVPCGNDAACPFDDRNQGANVIGLEAGIEADAKMARRQHAVKIGIGIKAQVAHRGLIPGPACPGGLLPGRVAARWFQPARQPARSPRCSATAVSTAHG